LQEIVFIQPYEAQGKGFAAYGQLHFFIYELFPGVKCTYEVIGSAFNFKGYYIIVWHYNRPNIQIMRGYGGNYKTGGFWKNHGTITA
jgi:hypothetical protein